jgi:hypothetical protein
MLLTVPETLLMPVLKDAVPVTRLALLLQLLGHPPNKL